jgi:AraC-like DNA-binding protein
MTEYRNERRIYKAKQMLFESEASIGDIAASLGFSSASYFSELFLKSENVSPTEYRKLHKN